MQVSKILCSMVVDVLYVEVGDGWTWSFAVMFGVGSSRILSSTVLAESQFVVSEG